MDIPSYLLGKKAGGSGGTSDYNDLSNKPSINNVALSGDKTTSDLGLFSGDYGDLTNKPDLSNYIIKSQTSGLVKNDGTIDTNTYLTQHQDITGKEDKTNKVTSLSSSSTDIQYPSAKCVYDIIGNLNTILATLTIPSVNNGGNE